jgi:hypothetical protein
MLAPGDGDRIDHAIAVHRFQPAGRQFVIEEAEIETGVVRHQRTVAQEGDQFLRPFPNFGLSDRNASDRPWTASASAGMPRSGLK